MATYVPTHVLPAPPPALPRRYMPGRAPFDGAAAPRLSIVLPCYNGGAYVVRSLRLLFGWLRVHAERVGACEVILADDGSTDDTLELVRGTGLPVRIVRLQRNRGKGAAVRRGMLLARGRYRIFMDADAPFDLDVIRRILDALETHGADICIGSRTAPGASWSIARTRERRLASAVFADVARRLVPGLGDTQCGVKGFRAEVAEYLFRAARVDRFAFDVELLYLARRNGFRVEAIPVAVVSETPSTLRMVRDSVAMLIELARLPIRFHRGDYPSFGGAAH